MPTEDDTFEALRNPPTEDEIAFGRNRWIYCSQHLRPHATGWCSVSDRDKLLLDARTMEEAFAECIQRRLDLYKD